MTDALSEDRMATLRGSYRNGFITIEQYSLRTVAIMADGEGIVDVGVDGSLDFQSSLKVNGIDYSFRGFYNPRESLILTGPYGVRVRAVRTAGGGIRVNAEATEVPLPRGDATVSTIVEGLYLSPDDWYVTLQEVAFRDVPIEAGLTADADMAVSINADTIDMAVLRYDDGVSTLAGTMLLEFAFDPTVEIRGNGRLSSPDGTEQYRIVGRYHEDTIAVDLRFEQAPLRRAVEDVEEGTISGSVQIAGNMTSPQVRGTVESETLRIGDQSARISTRFFLDDQTIEIRDTDLVAAAREMRVDSLILERDTGFITGELSVHREETSGRIDISVAGQTDPLTEFDARSWDELSATMSIRTTSYPSTRRNAAISTTAEVHEYSLVKGSGRTDIQRSDGGIRAVIFDDSTFNLTVQDPFPVRGEARGSFRNGEVELTAAGIFVDLTEVDVPVSDAGVTVIGGFAEGSIRVIGPVGNPDLYGTLRISNLELRSPFSPDTIGPVDGAFILEDKVIRVPEIRTHVGNAAVSLSGEMLLDRWTLQEYRINASIPGQTGVHIVNTFGPVNVDGFARGEISFSGSPGNIVLDGDLSMYNTELGVIPLAERENREVAVNTTLNLVLTTGRGVRFIWPAADFPVIRSNFAIDQEVEITLDTVEEQFGLTGTVEIQSGDVFYFDRNFLIRDGRIVFQENQDRFDPRITARAELREVTTDGPVRIYLVADGQRLSEFSPRFESNPPLGGTEIVSILGGNIFQQGADSGTNLSAALLSTSDIVTQFGVFREFENNVREQLGLDLFAIRTSVIQNLLLSAIAPTDETAAQLAPTLGTYLNNTSIFAGRYIGESVFAQGILQMRSADMARPDEDDGIQRLGGVLIDSEISLEWQTPFFMLEWSLSPENPEELFIRDNTFTFSWSFTY